MLKQFFLLATGVMIALSLVMAPSASAQIGDQLCRGVAVSGDDCDPDASGEVVNSTLKNIVNTLSLIVGFVAVLMLIIGGFRYVLSNGDSGGIESAKNTIIYAIVGLIIVASSQVIVQFVLTEADPVERSSSTPRTVR